VTSDFEVAFAFIARRQATKAMSASRWSHMLSLELGWMNPGQARTFVERGVNAGLLTPDGDTLRLVIDPASVEVPRGFKPNPDASAGPAGPASSSSGSSTASAPADPFLGWVAKVAAQRGLTRDQVLGQVAAAQEELGGLLTAEAAVLLLARRNGLDVRDAARAAEGARQAKPSR
jgi:hypothetical protein